MVFIYCCCIQATPGGFVITDEFQSTPAIISPHDYQAMRQVESALDRKLSKVFLLEQNQNATD